MKGTLNDKPGRCGHEEGGNVSWESELYVIKLKALSDSIYSKKMSLNEIKDHLEVIRYGKTYYEYARPGLLYFTEDLNALTKELGVEKIVPMGLS
jgi:hypothetical protein